MRPRRDALALLAAALALAVLALGGGRADAGGPLAGGARVAVDTAGDTCLNLRAAPALAAPIAACLPEGTGLTARGERAEADGYVWEAVAAGPRLGGWVASGFLARLDPPPAPSPWPLAAPPPARGVELIAWPGGTIEGLGGAAAAAGGCALRSAWANGADGGFVRYRFGASAAANRAFLDRYEDASPIAGEPLLLACAAETPAPPDAPPSARYDRLDATGEAAAAGAYAFLDADGEPIATWEGLRRDAAVLRLGAGADGEAFAYDGAEAGGVLEWRAADGCWVRYLATALPRGERAGFAVEPLAWAAVGCAGALPADAGAEVSWNPPPLAAATLEAPARHGPWLLIPTDWEGVAAPADERALPAAGASIEPRGGASPPSGDAAAPEAAPFETSDAAEARRRIALWRDPAGLPEGWTLALAEAGTRTAPADGYRAIWDDAAGRTALRAEVRRLGAQPDYVWAARGGDGSAVTEARAAGGRPALVRYSPPGPAHDPRLSVFVRVFDAASGLECSVRGYAGTMRGGDPAAAIEAALGLCRPPEPTGGAVLPYDRRDTTGGATAAGSYAFLRSASDLAGGDAGSAWLSVFGEGLLVHQTDAGGVSRSGFYGDVEAGDEFTAWVTADCWGHYEVTAVLADPPDPPRKRFSIESVTYESEGCGDTAETAAAIEFRWGPPPPLETGADGIPWMRQGQPVGGGTYRLGERGRSFVIDVPAGMRLIFAWVILSDPFPGEEEVVLKDEESGSRLFLAAETGADFGRTIAPGSRPDVSLAFDLIVASARPDARADGIPWLRLGRPSEGGRAYRVWSSLVVDVPSGMTLVHRGWTRNDAWTVSARLEDEASGSLLLVGGWHGGETGRRVTESGAARNVGALFDAIAASARTGEGEAVLRYHRRDTTGGATAAGSYAFLEDASDLASGEGGEGWVPGTGYDKTLLVHQTDADGVSRSSFYSEVKVGDEFTLWLSKDCWGHYEVTSVLADPPAPPRKRFDFQSVTAASHGCSSGTVEADAAIEFRWGPPPPLEVGDDGIPRARRGQPLGGGGAYRVSSGLVIDVPAGMTLIYRGWALNDDGTFTVSLEDEESGSLLLVDGFIGEEHGRRINAGAAGASGTASRDVGALFDAIIASAAARLRAAP